MLLCWMYMHARNRVVAVNSSAVLLGAAAVSHQSRALLAAQVSDASWACLVLLWPTPNIHTGCGSVHGVAHFPTTISPPHCYLAIALFVAMFSSPFRRLGFSFFRARSRLFFFFLSFLFTALLLLSSCVVKFICVFFLSFFDFL